MNPQCFSLCDLHKLSYLRDTALAIKHSAAFLLTWHERELTRDRSGKSALHRDVVSEMKALEAVASKTLVEAKGHVQRMKEMLSEGGWLDKVLDWTFGSEDDDEAEREAYLKELDDVVGGRAGAEEWTGRMLESWRDNVKGWLMVRWE